MLPIERLHHFARLTKKLDESRAFYRDVLGFQEIPRPDLRFPGAWLANYGLQVHLIVSDAVADPQGEISSRDNHLAFHTQDLEGVERALQAAGIAYRVNIQPSTGLKQFFFRDPDGHHVEVASYPG